MANLWFPTLVFFEGMLVVAEKDGRYVRFLDDAPHFLTPEDLNVASSI
jgi:hypothetical protein